MTQMTAEGVRFFILAGTAPDVDLTEDEKEIYSDPTEESLIRLGLVDPAEEYSLGDVLCYADAELQEKIIQDILTHHGL